MGEGQRLGDGNSLQQALEEDPLWQELQQELDRLRELVLLLQPVSDQDGPSEELLKTIAELHNAVNRSSARKRNMRFELQSELLAHKGL